MATPLAQPSADRPESRFSRVETTFLKLRLPSFGRVWDFSRSRLARMKASFDESCD
jgi:hypothetical protein